MNATEIRTYLDNIIAEANAKMAEIATIIDNLGATVLPLSYTTEHLTINVTLPKTRRGGGGKRNFIEYDEIGFASGEELALYLGIDTGMDSAPRKLKSAGIEYAVIDSDRYDELKKLELVYVDGMSDDDAEPDSNEV